MTGNEICDMSTRRLVEKSIVWDCFDELISEKRPFT